MLKAILGAFLVMAVSSQAYAGTAPKQNHHCKMPDGSMDMAKTHRECKEAKGKWAKDAETGAAGEAGAAPAAGAGHEGAAPTTGGAAKPAEAVPPAPAAAKPAPSPMPPAPAKTAPPAPAPK